MFPLNGREAGGYVGELADAVKKLMEAGSQEASNFAGSCLSKRILPPLRMHAFNLAASSATALLQASSPMTRTPAMGIPFRKFVICRNGNPRSLSARAVLPAGSYRQIGRAH